MRAAVFRDGELMVGETADPTPAAGQVLVRTHACGICGSDLHFTCHAGYVSDTFRRVGSPFPIDLTRDIVLGHEFCGEVVETSADAGLKAGDLVCSVPFTVTDGRAQLVGYSADKPGGFGRYMALNAANLVPVRNGLPAEHAALTEPLAVGWHAVQRGRVGPQDVALVIGCGPIGLAVVAALKVAGVHAIVVADFNAHRRGVAQAMGADVVVDPAERSPYAEWAALAQPPGYDPSSVERRTGAYLSQRPARPDGVGSRGIRARGLAASALAAAIAGCGPGAEPRHNVLIFVADGLRYASVGGDTPAMSAVRRKGVDFQNSHAVFPSITTPNAAAIATGRFPGDGGDFANSVYVGGAPLPAAYLSQVAGLEDDPVLGDMNVRFGGNYLGRPTLLAAARAAGFQTAVVGKLGPALVQDPTARDGRSTVVVDDVTGQPEGLPLPAWATAAMAKAGLGAAAPDRGLNSSPGDAVMAGVRVPNTIQQDWFARVAAEVLLPRFAAAHAPFVMVFWSRDPDGTQHNQGDSLHTLQPGINGATSRAAVRNADDDLARLRATLKRLGLERTTDVVVTSDHGFSTLSRQSASSPAAGGTYPDTPRGFLPAGFLALDLGRALGLPVWEPNGLDISVLSHPKHASAILGRDPRRPDVVIGANGGADMIWLPTPAGRALAPRIADAVTRQDYLGALFAADSLGPIAGALPTSAISWRGAARTPAPDMAVVFRSGPIACGRAAELCGVEVADNELQQGQGIHGALGRADTRNMMAAVGPDFRRGFADAAPVGNVDWAPTLAHLLGLKLDGPGVLKGRVLTEALTGGGAAPASDQKRLVSTPAANGFRTVLDLDVVRDGPTYVRSSPPRSPP